MIREEIYPNVVVYHNAIPQHHEFLEIAKTSTKYATNWTDWYTLGRQSTIIGYPHLKFEHFPTTNEWNSRFINIENPLVDMVSNAFYMSTADYVKSNFFEIPNWVHGAPTIHSHFAKTKDRFLAMQYHTDLIMSEIECRGFKHLITCNVYLNDEYEGGELSFKIFKNDTDFDFFKIKIYGKK